VLVSGSGGTVACVKATNQCMVYLRARYYQPGIGRFTSEDIIHDGTNWYAFCRNNPVRFTDRTGLAPEDHDEFGKDSAVAEALDALGVDWKNATTADAREKIHQKAELLRGLTRQYFANGNKKDDASQKKCVEGFQNVIKYESCIKAVSDSLHIDSGVLATVVFRETIMTDWGDLKDFPLAYIGLDTVSVGLCQIQPGTAREAYDNWLSNLIGKPTSSEAQGLTDQQLVKNLNDPNQSIRYAGIIIWDYINTQGKTSNASIFTAYTGNSETGKNEANYVSYMQYYFMKL